MGTKENIHRYIAQHLLFSDKGYPYSDDTSFLNEGIIDSVGLMELVAFVQENFDIEVEPQDLVPENFDSVTKMARFISSKQTTAARV